jgi:hypothetical protein
LVVATEVFPFFSKYWNSIFGFFGTITDLLYVKIILILGFLFVVPFLLCSIITIIVFHCTKNTPLSITGSVAKSAKQLNSYISNSPYFENFVELLDEEHALWRRLTGIISGICIAVILLYSQGLSISQSKDFLAVFSAIFKSAKCQTTPITQKKANITPTIVKTSDRDITR